MCGRNTIKVGAMAQAAAFSPEDDALLCRAVESGVSLPALALGVVSV